MCNFQQLPSGKTLSLPDIIYISNIKDSQNKYSFKVTWASRVSENMIYDNEELCRKDWMFLNQLVLNAPKQENMVLS